jgi:hypothetical protein
MKSIVGKMFHVDSNIIKRIAGLQSAIAKRLSYESLRLESVYRFDYRQFYYYVTNDTVLSYSVIVGKCGARVEQEASRCQTSIRLKLTHCFSRLQLPFQDTRSSRSETISLMTPTFAMILL